MKNLLKIFLGIFILLNLSGTAFAANYNTAGGYNNSEHSLAYKCLMAEKEKKQHKTDDGIGTVVLFITAMTIFFGWQFVWKY